MLKEGHEMQDLPRSRPSSENGFPEKPRRGELSQGQR